MHGVQQELPPAAGLFPPGLLFLLSDDESAFLEFAVIVDDECLVSFWAVIVWGLNIFPAAFVKLAAYFIISFMYR